MPPTAPTAGLVRRRMSHADYLALPDEIRAEWVDGEVVMSPSPSFRHQQAARRVANLLEAALPGLHVVEAVTVRVAPALERIPDVSVLTTEPQGDHITEVPLIVVEVLSPGTMNEDTVRKSTEYLAAGIGQYWLVDPQNRVVEVFQGSPGGWEAVARLDDAFTRASVEVPPRGVVIVDLDELLGRPDHR